MCEIAKLKNSLLVSVFILIMGHCGFARSIVYVDARADSINNGSSWGNAYTYLQDALADTNSMERPVEIRVAQGVYRPDKGANHIPGDRMASFELAQYVSLMGGFAGLGAADPNRRDFETCETILSGDLARNDMETDSPLNLIDAPSRSENSYHVVTASYTSEQVVLDGFTIVGGNANGGARAKEGGAFGCWRYHELKVLPTIKNCVIKHNSAKYGGGLSGCGQVVNCIVTRNIAQIGGGLVCCGMVENCVITHNVAKVRAGGLCNCDIIDDCIVSDNRAELRGGGMESDFGSTIRNCIIANNEALLGGGTFGPDQINNCLIVGNHAENGAGVQNCKALVNCTVSNNHAELYGGGLHCSTEALVLNSIIWGNTAAQGSQLALYGASVAVQGSRRHPPIGYDYYGDLSIRYSNVEDGASHIYKQNDKCLVAWGDGNCDISPLFVDQDNNNYHLKSQAGHWDSLDKTWIMDDLTSPCIDAGDPNSPIMHEPFPNGGVINMGAYGGTAEASKSYFGEPVCETIVAGDINGDGKVDFEDLVILIRHWMLSCEDLNMPNDPNDSPVTDPNDNPSGGGR